ncbi:hypothetical protein KQI88_10485 [Alkaliphilus sp. MSJ-5]|uniref:Uncharacterized protein n=1 Tax=Alkaliphilus flagellatus TaxID=2841507 RepID=A0ABS6G5Z7_9FIRM|nr:hypothetical protein [Alkaliphilus flagellatus]MBU5676845.1 hypothetical protein [Alkaliphilus flagellatus]
MSDIKRILTRLECAYCIRNSSHGGEYNKQKSPYDEKRCLVFKPDPKGCIRRGDVKISTRLYYDFPPLNTWCQDWQINGIDTAIKIIKIYGLD